jgi:hypothetical protein
MRRPCFLHHAEIIAISGKSYRLRNQARTESPAPDSEPEDSKPANLPTGSTARRKAKPAAEPTAACES